MKKTKKSPILSFILSAIFVYTCVLAGLYVFQRNLMYFPGADILPLQIENYQAINVETNDGITLKSFYAPPTSKSFVFVYFHGNGGNLKLRLVRSNYFIDQGYGFLYGEYRGYGGNPGATTERGLYRDARAYIEWLKMQGIKEEQMVFYGESLGTGIAVQMATEYQPAGLILEAAYDSIVGIAQHQYFMFPVRFLMKDQYKTIDKIEHVQAPTLFIHGDLDPLIQPKYSRILYDKTRAEKEYILIEGASHSDVYEFGAALHVMNFLRTLEQ